MDAIISARASAVAFVEGNDCRIAHWGGSLDFQSIDFGALKYVFDGLSDVAYLPGISREEAVRAFSEAMESEEATHLIFILLDTEVESEIRFSAASELNSLLGKKTVVEGVQNILFSRTLPDNSDLSYALEVSKDFSSLSYFLTETLDLQSIIGEIRSSWDNIPQAQFEGTAAKERFLNSAIRNGAFRKFVRAVADSPDSFNATLITVMRELKDQPNSRLVTMSWTKRFRTKSQEQAQSFRYPAVEETSVQDQRRNGRRVGRPAKSGFDAYQKVLSQQRAIKEHLREGNTRLARKFASDLVSYQIALDKQDLAAKSLCNIAQEANRVGQYSLQLEWAKEATELAPEDSHTYGHLADAYTHLGRFDDALLALGVVEKLGDSRFAATSRARVLQLEGRLDEALLAYDELRKSFGREADNSFAWNGYAEVLRDMWRFNDSLRAYEEAVDAFPQDSVSQSAKATVLTELGRLDDARQAYDQLLELGADDDYIVTGRAYVSKQMGELDEALVLYRRAIAKSPEVPNAVSGAASVLRQMRRFDEALEELKRGIERFPHEPALVCEIAEVFRDQGRAVDAWEVYQEARRVFPWSPRVSIGVAQATKDLGNYADALQVYDQTIQKFPYDQPSYIGRADCLKRLGRFNDSLNAYDTALARWPDHVGMSHSKASVYVIVEDFEKAEKMLPSGKPETLQEWIAHHIRGMILLKTKKVDEAITHFEDAIQNIPFAKQRAYFQSALAVAFLRKKSFDAIPTLSLPREPLTNVLMFHAYAASGKRADALRAFEVAKAVGPAQIIALSDEIARRFRISSEAPRHDEEWIFTQECQSLLLEAA